ncbi:ATP-dependent DNA ligase [Paenibacillus filicis]|uniref:ATP-dependent DNA ligase n=1 Tax=Paenibacillus gyeongsangnamensis TaxID=3388067 RepID=A0ABT4QJK3_9BACL|nr:ATP-dependent DNA ligase [Paenibacillus filicis]MCZ8517059.1 ATP-dependent DNA ligase [Paenibacillus filicis]
MFIPMLPERYEEPFNDGDYIFEPKIDGHRLIYTHLKRTTRMYSRSNNDITKLYPELYHLAIDEDIVLDGEVAIVNPATGLIDFESIQERFALRDKREIVNRSIHNPVNYIVFDILFYKGRDLRGLSLMKRREILAGIDFGNRHIGKIPFIEANGCKLFEEIRERKMEGILAKSKDSLYEGYRSDHWLKIDHWQYDEFYITGYKKDQSGFILSKSDKNSGFKQVGIVSRGITPIQKMTLFTEWLVEYSLQEISG